MGMFDKDKEIGRNLTNEFKEREEFILYAARIDPDTIPTEYGEARKTRLLVATMSQPREAFEVTTLGGAIADKVEKLEDQELPAIVKWLVVSTSRQDATVIQYVADYPGGPLPEGDPSRAEFGF